MYWVNTMVYTKTKFYRTNTKSQGLVPAHFALIIIVVHVYSKTSISINKYMHGKLGHSCTNVINGKLYGSEVGDHAIVHLGLNVSSSAHNCGCVVNGSKAM